MGGSVHSSVVGDFCWGCVAAYYLSYLYLIIERSFSAALGSGLETTSSELRWADFLFLLSLGILRKTMMIVYVFQSTVQWERLPGLFCYHFIQVGFLSFNLFFIFFFPLWRKWLAASNLKELIYQNQAGISISLRNNIYLSRSSILPPCFTVLCIALPFPGQGQW